MYYIGLDLGQAADFTAMCILEKTEKREYHIRHLKRFQLGTTYPAIVQRLVELTDNVLLNKKYQLVVDATGVGRPVVDLLRQAKISTIPVTISAGDKEAFDNEMGGWRVPKRILVSNLQVLLQTKILKFASDIEDIQILVNELLNFKVKITPTGNDTYEAWREGDHDDLVLAMALAAWYANKYGIAGEPKKKIPNNPWLHLGPNF